MNQKRILKAINDYYKSDIITEMGLIMHRQSYVKETVNTENRHARHRWLYRHVENCLVQ